MHNSRIIKTLRLNVFNFKSAVLKGVQLFQNVGKALRITWRCLVLGLYNFALGYSTPITVAATFAPDFHPGRNTSWGLHVYFTSGTGLTSNVVLIMFVCF